MLWLCDRFGVDARRTVLVGDSVADMQAGQAAGALTVAVLWGSGRCEVLAAYRSWRIVEQPAHLTFLLADLTAQIRRRRPRPGRHNPPYLVPPGADHPN
ncbi:HAD hydrolase-like protein [Streptomyces sp. NPDC048106]|uniref:HAD family hydrolase n=1 Tax=Streptomyces sp. NPDC048106 TaxID=3155750 RepID=UPI0034557541